MAAARSKDRVRQAAPRSNRQASSNLATSASISSSRNTLVVDHHVLNLGIVSRRDLTDGSDLEGVPVDRRRQRQRVEGVVVVTALPEPEVAVLGLLGDCQV
jgi:hypothetical protein